MSIQARFSEPPRQSRQASLYLQAKKTMQFVEQTRGRLEQLDNKDGVDLNLSPNQFTIPGHDLGLAYKPVGTTKRQDFTSAEGGLSRDGSMEVVLQAPKGQYGREKVKVAYRETATEKVYRIEADPQEDYAFAPGDIEVRENKAKGTLFISQENDFPFLFDQVSTGIKEEVKLPGTGPRDLNSIPLAQKGAKLEAELKRHIERLKARDGGPDDLSPEPGVVVVADYDSMKSDNSIGAWSGCKHQVPTEAHLFYDPESGEVEEMVVGFAGQERLAYRRDGEGEHYSSRGFLNYEEMIRKADGSTTVREHSSIRQPDLKKAQYREALDEYRSLPWYKRVRTEAPKKPQSL